jgi:hypothetical protein
LQFPGRGQSHLAVGIEQFEGSEGAGQFAANAVVDRDAFGIGRHLDRVAGGGVECLVIGDDHHLVAGQIQAVFRHGSQDAHGVRVGVLGDLLDGSDLVAGVFGRQHAHPSGSSAACAVRLPRQSNKAINVFFMKVPSAIGAVQRQVTGRTVDQEYDELRRGEMDFAGMPGLHASPWPGSHGQPENRAEFDRVVGV